MYAILTPLGLILLTLLLDGHGDTLRQMSGLLLCVPPGCGVRQEDTGASASIQTVYSWEASHHKQPARRVRLAITHDAYPEPDITNILQSGGFRAHREFSPSLRDFYVKLV